MFTGRTLYAGTARSEGPISPGEFRAVVLGLLVLMAAVLALVLRAPPAGSFVLPAATALAEPGRRLAATLIDLGATLLIVRGLGLWPASLLDPAAWFDGTNGLTLGATVVVAVLNGAVCEGLWGKTPGKVLVGCEVVLLGRTGEPWDPRPPGPARALVRNLVKWVLPPVAVLGVLDPEGMHRGDSYARTAVVVRIEPEPPEEH